MKRTAAENAYTVLEDGVYTVHAEVPGTELNEQTVLDGLRAAVSVLGVTADGPQDTAFELTSVDCYKRPRLRLRRCETRRTACSARRWQSLKSR